MNTKLESLTEDSSVDEKSKIKLRRAGGPFRNTAEIFVLLFIIVLFSILKPDSFLTLTNLRTILNQASIPIIIGVGTTLVILMGSIDLSIEGIMGASGMAFVLMSSNSRNDLNFGIFAFIIAMALGAALGLFNGVINAHFKVPSFISSFGVWYVGLGIAAILFGDEMIPFLQNEKLVAWPTSTSLGVPNSFIMSIVVLIIGYLIERFTRLGRYPYAIGNNESVAITIGIPVKRYRIYVFMAAGICNALGGVLGSLSIGAGAANVGNGVMFLTLAAVVIGGTPMAGGRGGVLRTLLGVLILTTLYNGLIHAGVTPNIQSGVSGIVILCAVIATSWTKRKKLGVVK